MGSIINDNAPLGDDLHTANSVDVRYYISILRSWWREMVLVVILAALAAGVLQWRKQPTYEAAAYVAIGHPEVDADAQTTAVERGLSVDRLASSAALLGLVHQGEVARVVRERLGERFAGVHAAGLLEMIVGDFVTYRGHALSDLIRITARAWTPQEAADLATIWAEEYVASVNRLQQRGNGRLDALRAELVAALEAGERSQRRLEAFLAKDDAEALRRELRANDSAVESLWAVRNNAGSSTLDVYAHAAPERTAIAEIESKSRALRTRIEAADDALRVLTMERDAVHSLVRSLRDEMARLKVRTAAASPRAQLASAALMPARRANRSWHSAAAIVGLAALPTAVLLAWFAHAMGVRPPIASAWPRRRR